MTPLPPGVDVERVLERLGISGRARGRRFWALCMYHEDSKPSWMIRLDGDRRGNFMCYSCKKSGDLFHLVEHVLGVGFKEARAWLTGVEPRPPPNTVRVVVPRGRAPFELPAGVVVAPLDEWVPVARDYAISRGITPEQTARWGLGYAVGGPLDGRVVFPVRDREGRPVGYTARTFVGDPKRYLAASERERPDPSAMFGEAAWPGEGEPRRDVVALEGAINALAVERAAPGLPFAALGGSNPTAGRVLKLASFARVWILTDADAAGDHAADAMRMALARHVEVGRLVLPRGKDPADLEREDPALLRKVLRPAIGSAV